MCAWAVDGATNRPTAHRGHNRGYLFRGPVPWRAERFPRQCQGSSLCAWAVDGVTNRPTAHRGHNRGCLSRARPLAERGSTDRLHCAFGSSRQCCAIPTGRATLNAALAAAYGRKLKANQASWGRSTHRTGHAAEPAGAIGGGRGRSPASCIREMLRARGLYVHLLRLITRDSRRPEVYSGTCARAAWPQRIHCSFGVIGTHFVN